MLVLDDGKEEEGVCAGVWVIEVFPFIGRGEWILGCVASARIPTDSMLSAFSEG